ncbi:glutathione S-transferase [Salmonella enterica subsp. enterica]|uniref:Glutathione S-transferase n=1 Tax=Salmonella enterica I TaxID=59201 RepID=A0A447U3R9_SALET|nr:glutathione S-transferase [Salmonella enterica subsp. enterica]
MKLFYKTGVPALLLPILPCAKLAKTLRLMASISQKKRLENGDDYLAVNPKGQVPALLLDDGTTVD